MGLLSKYLLAFVLISLTLIPTAFAEKNILGEEISILDIDVLDQEINKLINFYNSGKINDNNIIFTKIDCEKKTYLDWSLEIESW